MTEEQRHAVEWAIGMASQHNIHKEPLRAILAAGASEGQAVTDEWCVRKGNEDLEAWSLRVSLRKACEEMDAIREALGVDEECDYGDMIEKIEEASAEIAALRERIAGMEKDAERMKDLCKTLANIMQDQTVAMQSALIEWEFGKGAEAGFGWIVNTLEGPGNLPDPDAEHGKNAQFWFSANCADPMPKCFCGNPSNTLWMGQGFCCREHYNDAKAKYDAALAKEQQP